MGAGSKSPNLRQRRTSNLGLWSLLLALCLPTFVLLSSSAQSVALEMHWNSGDGDWGNVTCWSSVPAPLNPPGGGDEAYITQSDDTHRTVTFNLSYPVPEAERLEYVRVDGTGTGLPTLKMTGGDFYAHDEFIGFQGKGHFTQDGGTNNLSFLGLYLGYVAGSHGTYDLNDGALVANNPTTPIATIEYIGRGGTGVFNQNGGTNTAEQLALGIQPAGHGTYNLYGGALDAHDQVIGAGGPGVFNQTAGTNTVGFYLTLGNGADGDGTYDLSGGTLTSVGQEIGAYGKGRFIHSGGTNDAGAALYIARFRNAVYGIVDGTYELSGTGELSASDEYIGNQGQGLFKQTGGENTVTTYLKLGCESSGEGTYELGGGILTAGMEIVGDKGTGVFTQDGGSNTSINSLVLGYGGGDGTYTLTDGTLSIGLQLNLGTNGTGVFTQSGGQASVTDSLVIWNGTYNLDGGNLVCSKNILVSNNGTAGVFNQTAGTNTVAATVILGNALGDSGTYNLSGGSLSAVHEGVGSRGIGVFEQTGGTHTIGGQPWSKLILGSASGSSGTYHLSGGELIVAGDIEGGTGASTLNVDGGTLVLRNNTGGSIKVDSFNVGNAPGSNGSFTLHSGQSLVSGSGNIGKDGTGSFKHEDGKHTLVGALTIAANAGSAGTYSLQGGTLTADSIVNNDAFVFTGGELNLKADGSGTFTNNADANFDAMNGVLVVNGNMTNHGTVKTTNATLTFTGTYTELGTYHSDPSENHFLDLVVEASGYLIGGAGDKFFVGGNFTNNSTQAGLWDTADAYLGFVGPASVHTFNLAEVADVNRPYDYAWGTLELLDGGGLTLLGGDDAGVYVANLILSPGSTLNLNGVDIHVAAFEGEGATVLGDGEINIVPLPSTIALLSAGLIGLARLRNKVGK